MNSQSDLLKNALEALEKNSTIEALMLLEQAEAQRDSPMVRSYLAYCRAKVKREYAAAISLCSEALREDPANADHYLNLGRIYILAGKRGNALPIFRRGIKFGRNPQLMAELKKFDPRQPPVFSTLPRQHSLNRVVGKLFSRLGMR